MTGGKNRMKVLVTGVNGQMGHDMVNELVRRGHQAVGSDITDRYAGAADGTAVTCSPYERLDITDREKVSQTVSAVRPDAVIHCAAWTAVDDAELEENRVKVYAVNADGTKHLALAAQNAGSKMIYLSTDYVFSGRGKRPWQPDDRCFAPLNVYGQSKLEGERAVSQALDRYFIVRTSWVFGVSGRNFIRTMIRLGRTHETVRVVSDQIGRPTYAADLAVLLADMAETEQYGVYHATNEGGYISWYDLCRECYAQAGLNTEVIPVTTAEYGLSRAARPFNSRLDTGKLRKAGFEPLPGWRDAVSRYLREAGLQGNPTEPKGTGHGADHG